MNREAKRGIGIEELFLPLTEGLFPRLKELILTCSEMKPKRTMTPHQKKQQTKAEGWSPSGRRLRLLSKHVVRT